MKTKLITLLFASVVSAAFANTAPVPVVVSAAMRPGTTLMDVVFRVNDPDDATVKVRALAFVDGVRSFANVLRPVTFVEGTAAKIGDAIASNTDHTLTWDVGADWNIDLGQVKFEILARDARGLLAFDWITIPAAGAQPALTISKDAPSDASVLDGLLWLYAAGDPWLTLTNGMLTGNASSGVFSSVVLADAATVQFYSIPFILKRINLDPATLEEVSYAAITARAGLLGTTKWHAANRPYSTEISLMYAWGAPSPGGDEYEARIPAGLNDVAAIAIPVVGSHNLALKNDGTVVAWGDNYFGQATVPAGLTGVTAIAAGTYHSLALKNDGTVVGWGKSTNASGFLPFIVPAGLTGVTAIAGGGFHSLALKNDGTVVAWGGDNYFGQTTVPAGLTGVTAIAAGYFHSLALKNDGTVVAWGRNGSGEITIPNDLTGVTALAGGYEYGLALKSDGTVVGWGNSNPPAGLSGVIAIAAGSLHSLALKNDGTVVAWGQDHFGQLAIPNGLTGVIGIAAGAYHSFAFKAKAQ